MIYLFWRASIIQRILPIIFSLCLPLFSNSQDAEQSEAALKELDELVAKLSKLLADSPENSYEIVMAFSKRIVDPQDGKQSIFKRIGVERRYKMFDVVSKSIPGSFKRRRSTSSVGNDMYGFHLDFEKSLKEIDSVEQAFIKASGLRGTRLLKLIDSNHPNRHDAFIGMALQLRRTVADFEKSLRAKELSKIAVTARPKPTEDISEFVDKIRQGSGMKGLSLGVVKDGAVIALGCAGQGGSGQEGRLTPSDTYIIASCSKPMTATLAAMLVSEGKLKWETTIEDIFDEKLRRINSRYAGVTLAQLLSHTAGAPGMKSFWSSGVLTSAAAYQGDTRAKRFHMLELEIKGSPPERVGDFEYSNAGFCFAASMMEEVTGKSWEVLMKEYVFQTCQMQSAKPTTRQDSNPSLMAPAAGVSCTIEDFAKFAAFHIRGFMGNETVSMKISKDDHETMFSPANRSRAALGWFVEDSRWGDGKVYHHGGTNQDFNTEIWLIPEKRMAVVAATSGGIQGNSERRLDRAIKSIVSKFSSAR